MTTKMGQEQSDSHDDSVRLVREPDRQYREMPNGRGRLAPLFGPETGSVVDVHVIVLQAGGPEGRFHLHSQSENVYVVLAGSISVRLEDTTLRLNAGDAARLPKGWPHAVAVAGDGDATLLEIYAPAPADFVSLDDGH